MFDVGFSELVLVAIIALLVLGPERMPVAVRTLALWIGRLKRSYHHIRTEIEKEIGADEIRRQLRNEEIMGGLESSRKQIQNLASETTASLQKAEIQQSLEIGKKNFQDIINQASAKTPEQAPAKATTSDKND